MDNPWNMLIQLQWEHQLLHPEIICQEYYETGNCSQGRACEARHPHSCRYWRKGSCWRHAHCLYLHRDEDFNKDEKAAAEKDESEHEESVHDNKEQEKDLEEVSSNEGQVDNEKQRTADEIVDLYANVNLLESDHQLSTDEILKMYGSVDDNMEALKIKKTTRKKKSSQSSQNF